MTPDRFSFALNDRRDLRPIATVIVAVVVLVTPHVFMPTGLAAVAWIALGTLLCCSSHVVVHNHTHRPLFAHPLANRAFNLLASVARGHSVSDVLLPHNHNHHGERGGAGDWIAPMIAGDGPALLRLFRFTYRASFNMLRGRWRLGRAGLAFIPEPFRSSLKWEKAFLPAVVAASAVHDWRVFLVFQCVPWALGLAWLVAINLFQHDGCDPESEYAHSRNFVGPVTNWVFFNNGYHTIHHIRPGLHWADAREAHARVAQAIPPALNEPSIAGYFWRAYLARSRAP